MRAISTLSLDVGISARSCSALLALRMRVSMSATGSVSILVLLPRALRHAGNHALVSELAQADAAKPELLEHGARPAAAVAAGVVAHLVLRGPCGLHSQRLLRHLAFAPSGRERQPEPREARAGLLVVRRSRRDRDVEAANLVDAVVVDLRKDDLLADAERVVPAAVERVGAEPPEVANARQGDRDEPVEELPHPLAAQRDAHADRHAVADLELRDRLPGAAHLRALAGDDRQLLEGGVDLLGVGLALAHAHVERDLRDGRRLHDRGQPELFPQLGAKLVVVLLLEARHVALFHGGHQRSISWPQPSRLQTRTLTCSPLLTSLKR